MIKNEQLTKTELDQWLRSKTNTLFICGNDCDGKKEPRDGYLSNIVKDLEYQILTMTRTKAKIPHHFDIVINNEKKHDDITWYDITKYIEPIIKKNDLKNIILDITGMDLEILLYILPILQNKNLNIFCIYITPDKYSDEVFPIDTKEIQQPKGYNTFPRENIKKRAHLIVLGFDELRAEKFIKQYDWSVHDLYIVTGSNSDIYSKRALDAAGPTVNSMKNHHKHQTLNDPNKIIDHIDELLNKYDFIDIVPLGPKTILLGIIIGYLYKKDKDRERIRLLYDFPVSQFGRSEGIKEFFLFDCTEMLN